MGKGSDIWIVKGYELFALGGMDNLKVEAMAQQVGVSKSSFYHHFADMDLFLDHLLAYHLQQAKLLALKEKKAQSINPELVRILVAHKTDLLFSRQMRIHQHLPGFSKVLMQSNELVGNDFVGLWARELQWRGNMAQLEVLFQLALENFFLQINVENLEAEWLSNYFDRLKSMVEVFH